MITVATQAELDVALAAHDNGRSERIVVVGSAHVVASGSAHVVASGSAHVEAWDSAHVVAWGSAHVVAWGSAHVVASGSAHVEAWGAVQVRAYARAVALAATATVVVSAHGCDVTVTGIGVVVRVPAVVTPEAWCDYHGVTMVGGIATIYKAVRDDYRSARGAVYAPGGTCEAPDWDGGREECGGGLHFSPRPAMALEFDAAATRFVACPVALSDMRAPNEGDAYPHKIKARRCGPVVEVDRDGTPLATARGEG